MYFTEILFVVEMEQTQLMTEQILIATKYSYPFETQSMAWLIQEKASMDWVFTHSFLLISKYTTITS